MEEAVPHTPPIPRRTRLILALLTLTLTLGMAFGAWNPGRWFKAMDFFVHDLLMEATPSRPPAPRDQVTIVDIDEASLEAVGQWPWPRYHLARLLVNLNRAGARAIGLDILFPEADRSALVTIQDRMKRDFNVDIDLKSVPRGLLDNDGYLGRVMAGMPTLVGARYFYFDHTTQGRVCKEPPLEILDPQSLLSPHTARGMMCNTPALELGLSATGFVNTRYEGDGIIRRAPLVLGYENQLYPHLALALLCRAQGISRAQVQSTPTGPVLKAGTHAIPLTTRGELLLRFHPRDHHRPFIPALDILNQTADLSLVKDRIVLVGSTAMGLNDTHPTLFSPHFPGAAVSGVILENIQAQESITLPPWHRYFTLWSCLFTGLFLALFFYRVPGPLWLLAGFCFWSLFIVGMTLTAHFQFSLFLSPAPALGLSSILFSVFSLARFAIVKREAFLWYKRLSSAQQLTMDAMVGMVETRDPETGSHIIRTQNYARLMARELQKRGNHPEITAEFIRDIFLSAPLHDIGKVGIPDQILLKPGRHTDGEFEEMKKHALYGKAIIEKASAKHLHAHYLDMGAQIAAAHHERWDGTGYPMGLSGEVIPLAGRIMAISDVYDALISKRCYKPAFPHEKAMSIIRQERGKHFDPQIVDAFCAVEEEIKAIAAAHQDPEPHPEHLDSLRVHPGP
ncbi:MAG: CHASE2 domain-containing protein [Desulfobacterales bacterium]|nr:CHASE2 domain-containing protein [Desulfobacterales bacterium]